VRQQTLRGAIDWSYGLLDGSEQRLFRMLGAFAHGWTLEAVEAVYGDDEEGFVLEGLSSLIDKSLAQQDEGDGEPRFTMLETIRQFAIEQLEQSAECQEVRDRHATYFLALAETAAPELRGARQLDWLRRLEQENLNLQTALNWLVDKGDTETAVRLAWALWFFWWTHGHQNTVPPWLDATTTTSDILPVAIRAKAVAVAATIRIRQGDHERAAPLCDQALALFRELGDHDGEALALGGQGMVCMYRHNLGAATARFEEALALYRVLENKWGIAIMLGYIGRIAALQGDVELVSGALEESIATLLELGDKTTAVFTLNTLAMSALLDKNPFRAIGLLTYGLKLSEEVGSRGNAVYCLEGLAAVAADQGKYERAARLWGASEALREALRAPMAPNDRAFCEPFIEAARTHTDHAVFTTAWAEGRKLSLDQAVEYALEEGEYL
jgi:tetratricopeptide (TPR) repeat protein